MLVGNDTDVIVEKAREFLTLEGLESRLRKLPNPFGDGKASERMVNKLKECLAAEDV